MQLLSGSVTRGSAGSDDCGSGGVEFATGVVWLTRDVTLVLRFAVSSCNCLLRRGSTEQLVPSFLFLLHELQGNRLFSVLLGNFDAFNFVRHASKRENSLLARESDGQRHIGLARFCLECTLSHVIQTIKLEVNGYRILPSDQLYLVITSPWTSLSASPPDRSSC